MIPRLACGQDSFSVEKKHFGSKTILQASNNGFAPVYIRMELTEAANIHSDREWPFSAVIPPRTTQPLAILKPANALASSRWSYRYTSSIGDISAVVDRNVAYRLPFDEGTRFLIGQGYDQRTTHISPETHYAIDFTVPQGTRVLAVRRGTIVEKVMHHVYGGKEQGLQGKANRITVLHDDGTLAHYAHLLTNSSSLRLGQYVMEGELLALSGNTGYSSGPHLHFAVTINTKQGHESLPLIFVNGNPARTYLYANTGILDSVNYSGTHVANANQVSLSVHSNTVSSRDSGSPMTAAPLGSSVHPESPAVNDHRKRTLDLLREYLSPAANFSETLRELFGLGSPKTP